MSGGRENFTSYTTDKKLISNKYWTQKFNLKKTNIEIVVNRKLSKSEIQKNKETLVDIFNILSCETNTNQK